MEKKRDELSLRNLDSYGLDSIDVERRSKMEAGRKEREEYKRKYGSLWMTKYMEDKGLVCDYDSCLKIVNEAIYYGCRPHITGTFEALVSCYDLYEKRAREFYGDRYDELVYHEPGDRHIAKLLLDDAVKTGKWKELPDELQSEYKLLVGCDVQ